MSPADAATGECDALREENALLREHIRATDSAAGIAQELVIRQFKEVERVLSLLHQENALRKGILDAAAQLSIIFCDRDGVVRLFNVGAERLLGHVADEVVDAGQLADFHLPEELRAATGGEGAAGVARLLELAARGALPAREWTYVTRQGAQRPVNLSFSAVRDAEERVTGLMCAAMDISGLKAAQTALQEKTAAQAALLEELQQTQQQLLQSEKMASLGQLAAGVAHEINNPIGFVNSNLGTLGNYAEQLLRLVTVYEQTEPLLAGAPEALAALHAARQEADLAYLREDMIALVRESQHGLDRVKKIVQDLKAFSHAGQTEWAWAQVHEGIESTLNVVANELKYKATVERRYGDLPPIRCVLSQLNQVFMNLLVNAAQAMDTPGTITITTRREGGDVLISVADTGKGIASEHRKKIFDPFFTTKPVGSGTGLGLYLAFGIVRKHGGDIQVESEPGRGTTFTLRLPIEPAADEAAAA